MSLADGADKVIEAVVSDLKVASTWLSGPRGGKLRNAVELLEAVLEGAGAEALERNKKPLPEAATTGSNVPTNVAPAANQVPADTVQTPAPSAPDAPPAT